MNMAFVNREIEWLLRRQPLISRLPFLGKECLLEGTYRFQGSMAGFPEISQELDLRFEIKLTDSFFRPLVKETSSVIPKNGDHHVNSDGSFCIGSEWGIYDAMGGVQTMEAFVENCLDPYLFKVLAKVRGITNEIIGGELPHGDAGTIEFYGELLGFSTVVQLKSAANLILLKKRIANKRACPCGCGKKLGQCSYHNTLNKIRMSMFGKQIRSHCLGPVLALNLAK